MKKRMQSYKITNTPALKMFVNNAFYPIFFILLMLKSNNLLAQKEVQAIKTVCIDAGHGGKDPGCHGSSANEKTVCLNMALKLGARIKAAYPGIKVIYTRSSDVFVELDERAKIANRNKADLFISIHANSASPAAYGTETYVLGLHRTDAQRKIAEKENSSIYLEADKGEKYKDFDMSPDALIFKQLQMAVYLDQSIKFATNLQAEFKKLGRHDRGVKQAGFIVLYKTTMPSVLIESGFLTNHDEEKFLADTLSQTKMSDAMFVAFQKYKNELEGIDVMKGVTPTEVFHASTTGSNPPKNVPGSTSEPKAEEQKESSTSPFSGGRVIYRVQIETSDKALSPNLSRFSGLDLYEYRQDKLFKYTAGAFEEDLKGANDYKNELREKGFKSAFVVAFRNGERISLEDALKGSK